MYVCPPYFNRTFGGFVKLAIAPSVVSGNRTVRGQWQSHRPWSSAAENSPHSLNCVYIFCGLVFMVPQLFSLFLDVCMYVCPPYFNMTFGGIASVRLRCVFRVRLNEVGFPWLLGWLNEVGFPLG